MRIGPFEIQGELGRGGMGVVFRARDPVLGRDVALKVLSPGAPPDVRARFLREGRVAARLRHPSVVAVHAAGETEPPAGSEGPGAAYIAQELIEGRSLAKVLAEESLGPAPAARLVEKIARALAHAHAEGVIHRDVKPGNILLDSAGEPHLADFGLARDAASEERLSRSGMVVGTPHYMSPEQAQGRVGAVDGRTDVWACGVVLYECVAGAMPFSGETAMAVMTAIVGSDPVPLRRRAAGVPADLETIVSTCLEKDPGRRYPTAGALADDLDRFLRGEPIGARGEGPIRRLARALGRHRTAAAAAAAGGLTLLLAATAALPRLGTAEREAREARAAALEALGAVADSALDAALALRRAGDLEGMARQAARVESACREAAAAMPDRPEPHHRLGRILRAVLRDRDALAEQERALGKAPRYVPALYERVVLLARDHRRRVREVEAGALREEGERRARAGGGEVRPGGSGGALAGAGDPHAREILRRMAEDLRALEAAAGHSTELTAGEIACARGLLALVSADLDAARRRLAEAAAASPALEEAIEALAGLADRAGKLDEAVRWWGEGLRRDPCYTPHLVGRGHAQIALARARADRGLDPAAEFAGALADFDEAIRRDPSRPEAWVGRAAARLEAGLCLARRGGDPSPDYEAALSDLGRALQLDPGSAAAWTWRGGSRVNLANHRRDRAGEAEGLYREAVADLDEAIARDPDGARAWGWRGTARAGWGLCLAGRGEDPTAAYEAAEGDYGEALRRDPRDSDLWARRAGVRQNRGLWAAGRGGDAAAPYDAALADFAEAIALEPADPRLRVRRGFARMVRGIGRADRGEDPSADYAEAIADFEAALGMVPEDDAPWRGRAAGRTNWGNARRARGEDGAEALLEQGVADYREALRRNPGRVETWSEAATALANLGHFRASRAEDPAAAYTEAIEWFGEAVRRNPALADAYLGRGSTRCSWALFRSRAGQDDPALLADAISDLSEATRRNPGRSEAWMWLGGARVNAGLARARGGEDPVPDYDAAERDLGRALERNPRNATALEYRANSRRNRAVARRARGEDATADLLGAIEDYEAAARANPALGPALSGLRESCRQVLGDRAEGGGPR